ncbi:MAG: 3-oxoacyl-ACP synthase, partial [Bacteroidales bacterium]|nr:3-oxoacyl-ACP synthase [Bacteroidales bacterium]
NRSGSFNADTKYQATIQEADNFFPSPAIFVYTLPNIVTGEIAIRNLYYGETNFIVLDSMDLPTMAEQIANAFQDTETESVLTGWVDCYDENHFEARMLIINRNEDILNELNKIKQ